MTKATTAAPAAPAQERVKRPYNRVKPTKAQIAAAQARITETDPVRIAEYFGVIAKGATPEEQARLIVRAATAPLQARALPVVELTEQLRSDVRMFAFVMEAVAHAQGMQNEFLPIVERIRSALLK